MHHSDAVVYRVVEIEISAIVYEQTSRNQELSIDSTPTIAAESRRTTRYGGNNGGFGIDPTNDILIAEIQISCRVHDEITRSGNPTISGQAAIPRYIPQIRPNNRINLTI
jgi:hypothetical protein